MAAPLLIKADEGFVQACASHGASLARLAQVVRTGSALEEAQHRASDALGDMSKALQLLAAHERQFAGAVEETARAVEEAAAAARATAPPAGSPAGGALFSGSAGGAATFTGGASFTGSSVDAAASAAFNTHHAGGGGGSSGGGSIGAMFSGSAGDPYAASSGLYAATSPSSPLRGSAAEAAGASLPELLEAVAAQLDATGARWHEQLNELTELLLKPLL